MKEYLISVKWDIIFFSFVYLMGFVSSFIFIGGPVTYAGPLGVLMGYLLYHRWNYKKFTAEIHGKRKDLPR